MYIYYEAFWKNPESLFIFSTGKEELMDRNFIRSFCRNYYTDFQSEAVKSSEEYQEKRLLRYEVETKLATKIKECGNEIFALFEKYLDAYADEQEVLLEEMYLLGAEDREKMLR